MSSTDRTGRRPRAALIGVTAGDGTAVPTSGTGVPLAGGGLAGGGGKPMWLRTLPGAGGRYASCELPAVFKLLLISVVLAPVWLAVRAAGGRSARRPVTALVAVVAAYDVLYLLMLYYLHVRWVGWGAA